MATPKRTLIQTLYRYKIHHVILWLAYYILWLNVYRDQYTSVVTLIGVITFYFVFNALSFYLICYYLIPKYFNEGRYALFIITSMVVWLGCALGLAVCIHLQWRMSGSNVAYNYGAIFSMSLTTILTVLLVLGSLKVLVDKVRSVQHAKAVEHQRVESELQYLKAQVNPHFLFNAINSVYFLIRKDADKASETLIRLSDLLRFALYDCAEDRIAIEKELDYLQNYIALEQLRKGEKVKVDVALGSDLAGFTVAPFLLIPFLENAFKFVAPVNESASQIRFTLQREGDNLVATFYNTHDGLPKNTVGGIGLRNVKRRLELLYPGRHTLTINDQPHAYAVTLTLTV